MEYITGNKLVRKSDDSTWDIDGWTSEGRLILSRYEVINGLRTKSVYSIPRFGNFDEYMENKFGMPFDDDEWEIIDNYIIE